MNEILEQINYWLQQAWVYIPAILSVITAFGLPSLIQISKIFSSAKLYLGQVSKLLKKVNESVVMLNRLISYMHEQIDEEITYLENLKKCTYNKKQIAVIDDRLNKLEEQKAATLKLFINEIKKEEISKETIIKENKEAKKVKVRVKIKDNK